MSNRTRYDVGPAKGRAGWDVKKDGRTVSHHNKKAPAVEKATGDAKRNPSNAQVVIKKQDGRYQEERTYPRSSDPRRTPG